MYNNVKSNIFLRKHVVPSKDPQKISKALLSRDIHELKGFVLR